ncbi:chymotrypsin-1-like [Octopus vulgaris]|uniref:Chymotrypsin-1-like n=1 Tax=Octopus vulgaris TaxID=6645 RepID=A0AA36BW06_OCTVU|nr:chymotrypsin-1-like [Octopus vulgaris]
MFETVALLDGRHDIPAKTEATKTRRQQRDNMVILSVQLLVEKNSTDARVMNRVVFIVKGNSPDELYKVALPAIPHDVCTRRSRMRIADGVLCAGDFRQGGASTCQGDSGGPLYCPSSNGQMVLAGVTSFGNKCDNEVSAFSDVGYFRDWINSNL